MVNLHSFGIVLMDVMAGAEKYGRTFAIEYDISYRLALVNISVRNTQT